MPSTKTVGDHTLLVSARGTMLLHPRQDKIRWLDPDITNTDLPILIKDELLLSSSELEIVDVRTGKPTGTTALEGIYPAVIGTRLAGVGPNKLCLQRIG